MKWIYLALAILGLVIPQFFFFQFLDVNGFDVPRLFAQAFGNPAAAFFSIDLILTVIAFWVFLYAEARRLPMPLAWLFFLASLVLGPCFTFPLFLFYRQRRLDRSA